MNDTSSRDPRAVSRGVPRGRRIAAAVLAGTVTVLLPVFLVAAWNPWHLLRLMPFGLPFVVPAGAGAACVMLGVAGLLAARTRARAVAVAVAAAVLAVVGSVGGSVVTVARLLANATPTSGSTPVAVSPDGLYEVVTREYTAVPDTIIVVRIRSRAGLWSRESPHDVACVEGVGDVVGARFVAPFEVEVRTHDEVWMTTFDPHTLEPAATLRHGRCPAPR